jgi:hypothetical protein
MPEEKTTKKQESAENHKTDSEAKESGDKAGNNKKKFYKKTWFWLVLILGLAVVGVGIFLLIFFSAQSKNKKAVLNGWNDITKESNSLASIGEGVNGKESFDKYNSELQKFSGNVKDAKINTSKLSFKGQDVQRYEKFLDDYSTYTARSAELANKINDYTESDNTKLKELSAVAKSSASDARSNIKYLTQSMPDNAFQIQDVLTTANKAILAKELSIQAQQQAAQAQSAKDKADKTAVENNTGNYLNAFIAGNAATMRRYMTSAYQAEYDFNQISAEARNVVYPASFRILTVTKTDDTHYKSQANVLYKYRDGSGQYTVGNELNLVYDSGSATWLVNSVREGSAY